MAIALVQTGQSDDASSPFTMTWGSNTTSGNLIVIATLSRATSTNDITSITDSQSNTYTQIFSQLTGGAGGDDTELWYAANITGGTTPTITVTSTGGVRIAIKAREYSGIATTSPLDKQTSATGTGTALDSGSTATTSQANELIIGAGGQKSNTPTFTAGTNYGNLSSQVNGLRSLVALEDRIVSSTGTYNATIDSNASAIWAMGIATFKDVNPGSNTFGKLYSSQSAIKRAAYY